MRDSSKRQADIGVEELEQDDNNEGYHLPENNYSFDALQAYCFRINM